MIGGSRRQTLLGIGLVAFSTVSVFLLRGWGDRSREPRAPTHEYPKLFRDSETCPRATDTLGAGGRLEVQARLRADRYAYEARDGVLAVGLYAQSAACYALAGAHGSSARAAREAAILSQRVEADYAAARLNLTTALGQDRWVRANAELHRLRAFTEHVEAHDYVDWLEEIARRVAARSAADP